MDWNNYLLSHSVIEIMIFYVFFLLLSGIRKDMHIHMNKKKNYSLLIVRFNVYFFD